MAETTEEIIEIQCETCGEWFEDNNGNNGDRCDDCRGWNDDDLEIVED